MRSMVCRRDAVRNRKIRIIVRLYRRPFTYWYPGTDVVGELIRKYGRIADNGDFLVISEKALATAYGYIYDESSIRADVITRILTFILNRYVWGYLLSRYIGIKTRQLLLTTPIEVMARHKKLALRYGGFKHFIKPVSEAGIDAKNLPYQYVALPLRDANRIARSIYQGFLMRGKRINVLIIDTDRAFRPKRLGNIVFSTRKSFIRGIIDLGGFGYIIGKALPRLFKVYPTPVAYYGDWVSLTTILRIGKAARSIIGEGFGLSVYDMLSKLNKRSFGDVTWMDMNKITHYPAVLVRVRVVDTINQAEER